MPIRSLLLISGKFSNLVAYTITRQSPSPYRLKSTSLRLQIPQLGLFPESKFLTTMRESDTWRLIARAYFAIRTWSRRTIWGDRVRRIISPSWYLHAEVDHFSSSCVFRGRPYYYYRVMARRCVKFSAIETTTRLLKPNQPLCKAL